MWTSTYSSTQGIYPEFNKWEEHKYVIWGMDESWDMENHPFTFNGLKFTYVRIRYNAKRLLHMFMYIYRKR